MPTPSTRHDRRPGGGARHPRRKAGGRTGRPSAGRADPTRLAVARAYIAFAAGSEFQAEPPPHLKHDAQRRLYVHLLRGMVRHMRLLQHEVARLAARPPERLDAELIALAVLGLYQLRFLDTPPHAAVYETVELAPALGHRHGKGWVNGVLRTAQREGLRGTETPGAVSPAVRTSHPDWLVARWTARYGPECAEAICEANNRFEGTAVRVAIDRTDTAAVLAALAAADVPAAPHPLLADALWCEHAGALLQTPAFRDGLLYVQDAGSQLLGAWVAPLLQGRVLDACAAPGGKLTHLAALPGMRRLVGADRSQGRLALVRENQARLRLPALPLLLADGTALPFADTASTGAGGGWDGVLLDVPCSATGMIRKYPELKWRKHPDDPARLAVVQAALLAEAARVVRPGGTVVYATCSLEAEENEGVVDAFLADRESWRRLPLREVPAPAALRADPATLLTPAGDLLLLPGAHHMGLYGAVLQRRG